MSIKLKELGEKKIVNRIISHIDQDSRLVGGMGHDSAFLKIEISRDELLLLNTDRSGINVAYSLGLSDAECVGDFAVSHAVSDILAGGGDVIAVTLALLLPENLEIDFVEKVVEGANKAARRYGATIVCGDTKENPKFSAVVTAIGKCKEGRQLLRSGARVGDLIVVSGELGTMAAGILANGVCNVSLATTGIAGPKSDNTNKPVGLCFIAVGLWDNVFVYKYMLEGDREEITRRAINQSLFLLYKQIK